MRCTLFRLAVPVILALAAGGGVASAGSGFELMPGAVVDPDHGSVLVMRPDSGIAVLDLATGRERCTTRHAAKPLLVQGSRVLAQTESGGSTLRLYVLELAFSPDGACALTALHEVKVAMPRHVPTAIDERIDAAFRVRARDDGAGLVRVEWSHRESPAFPESFAERGAFLVDLSDGLVQPAEPDPAGRKSASRVLPPVPTASPREVVVGQERVSIAVENRTDGTRSVALHSRSATGGKQGSTKQLDAADVRALRLASDDRSLLVSALAPGAPPDERYVWSIYALDSGRKQAEVRAAHSGSPFWIDGSVVIYREDRSTSLGAGRTSVERPVRLVARSVSGNDGEVLWSYRIRDTAYRGVRAPAQPSPPASGPRRSFSDRGSR